MLVYGILIATLCSIYDLEPPTYPVWFGGIVGAIPVYYVLRYMEADEHRNAQMKYMNYFTHMIKQFIELVKSTTKWSGRFDRRQYVIVCFGMFLIGMVIIGFLLGIESVVERVFGLFELVLVLIWLPYSVVSVIVGVGAGVRRFHDLDLSGWHFLLLLIPLINFPTFLYLVFKSSKEVGRTRWG